MSKSKLVGRKVKLLPHCVFYCKDYPVGNKGVITGVSITAGTAVDLVFVNDHVGVVMPCYLDELRYLNNKPVVAPDE